MEWLTARSIQISLGFACLATLLAASGCGAVQPGGRPALPSANAQPATAQAARTGQAAHSADAHGQAAAPPDVANEDAVPPLRGTVIRSPSGRIIGD